MKKLILIYALLQSVLQMSFLTATEPELSELLEKDMQYYERVVKPRGTDGCINFINMVIQKYENKGIEPMYLVPVKEELELLQKSQGLRILKGLNSFYKFSAGIVGKNSVYGNEYVSNTRLGLLYSNIGISLGIDYFDTCMDKRNDRQFKIIPITLSFMVFPKNWVFFEIGTGYYTFHNYNHEQISLKSFYRYNYYDNLYSVYYTDSYREELENVSGNHFGFGFDIPVSKAISLCIDTRYFILKPTLKRAGEKYKYHYYYSDYYDYYGGYDDIYYDISTENAFGGPYLLSEKIDLSSFISTFGVKYRF